MLKQIPEELKKQGVRWVEVSSGHASAWKKEILVAELPNNRECKYLTVAEHNLKYLIEGKNYGINFWKQMQEIPQPQEPKKIPYTAETFPDNAIWVRKIGKNEKLTFEVKESTLSPDSVIINNGRTGLCMVRNMKNYEIGCQIIKDGEIKIEWKPFYQIKE